MLIVFSLLLVFLNSSFIFIFNGGSESITKTNLTLPDYMFTIRYFINNFKHLLLLLSGDIEIIPLHFFNWNLNGLATHDFIKMHLV